MNYVGYSAKYLKIEDFYTKLLHIIAIKLLAKLQMKYL